MRVRRPFVCVLSLRLKKPEMFVISYKQSITSGHTHKRTHTQTHAQKECNLLLEANEATNILQFITVSSPSGL